MTSQQLLDDVKPLVREFMNPEHVHMPRRCTDFSQFLRLFGLPSLNSSPKVISALRKAVLSELKRMIRTTNRLKLYSRVELLPGSFDQALLYGQNYLASVHGNFQFWIDQCNRLKKLQKYMRDVQMRVATLLDKLEYYKRRGTLKSRSQLLSSTEPVFIFNTDRIYPHDAMLIHTFPRRLLELTSDGKTTRLDAAIDDIRRGMRHDDRILANVRW